MNGRDQAHRGVGSENKAKSHELVPHKERERNASSRDRHVAEIVHEIIPVGALAIVRFVPEIRHGCKRIEMDSGLLLEERFFLRVSWRRTTVGEVGLCAKIEGSVASLAKEIEEESAVIGRRGLHETHRQRESLAHGCWYCSYMLMAYRIVSTAADRTCVKMI